MGGHFKATVLGGAIKPTAAIGVSHGGSCVFSAFWTKFKFGRLEHEKERP